jgi:hypothetical protein
MSINNFEPRVSQLVIYPVKGLAGQPFETVEVLDRGFAWDRRWMLVGEDHTFLSQRQLPRMATIQARIAGDELVLLHSSSQSKFAVPIQQPDTAPKMSVTIWKDQVEALCIPDAGHWLSEILDYGCALVFMPDTTRRPVNPAFARPGEIVSFADAYPILLLGGASISDLNARLTEPVPVDRFRPNIVASTQEPFEEDQWGELEIGSAPAVRRRRIPRPEPDCQACWQDRGERSSEDHGANLRGLRLVSGPRNTFDLLLFLLQLI